MILFACGESGFVRNLCGVLRMAVQVNERVFADSVE
jgi:hypothetical protein